jgi:mono/diheme cytochrome c family protein
MKRICILSLATVFISTAVAAADDKVDFSKQIQPLLVEHCASCHGAEKGQGKLRLHTADVIKEKQTAKPQFLVSGNPDDSELYKRLVLPADNAKRMPKKADPLPKEKIELIAKWIKEGATLPATVAAAEASATTEKKPAQQDIPPAPKKSLDKLAAAGAQVMPLSAGNSRLWVSFAHRDRPVADADIELLAEVAEQVDTLNLAGSKVTAAGLAPLANLKNLSKLHLENSSINDEGLAHLAKLNNLRYLNLYGTAITDAGLKHLGELKQLKNLFLWQTKVSFDAAMALENDTPGLEVDLGYNHPMVAKKRLTSALESAKEQAENAKAEATKLEQQLEAAKKNAESTAARVAEIEKELKSLETEPAGDKEKTASRSGDQEAKK